MHRKALVLWSLAILVGMMACSLFSGTATPISSQAAPKLPTPAQPTPSGIVKSITLTTATEGEEQKPVDTVTSYPPKGIFHAVVRIEDAPPGTKVKATWYVVDAGADIKPETVIDSYEVTTEGSRNVDFTLEPSDSWPKGSYRVEIFINGQQEQRVLFQVE